MPEVYRIDRAKVKQSWKLDSGSLLASARLTRIGIFIYRNADGSERKEYRPANEVFDAASLETLNGVPVTIGHPGIVTANNWAQLAKGHTQNPKADGDYVSATVRIDDAPTVGQLERGELSEVSCGYKCEYDPTPGVYKGQRYDGVQRNIKYNHLAVLSGEGRAGPECRVMLDGKDYDISTLEIKDMDLEQALKALGTAEANLKVAVARADSLEGERDTLKLQVEKLEGERLDEAELADRVDARVELLSVAKTVLKDFDAKGKSDADIRKAVIAKVEPSLKLDGKSDEYVIAVFDMASAKIDRHGANTGAALGALETARTDADGKKNPIKEARERQAARNKARYDQFKAGDFKQSLDGVKTRKGSK